MSTYTCCMHKLARAHRAYRTRCGTWSVQTFWVWTALLDAADRG